MSIHLFIAPVFLVACSSSTPNQSNDGGAEAASQVSFRRDVLPLFAMSCAFSSCHQDPAADPTMQKIFLGCNTSSGPCAVPDAGGTIYSELMMASQELTTMPYVTP